VSLEFTHSWTLGSAPWYNKGMTTPTPTPTMPPMLILQGENGEQSNIGIIEFEKMIPHVERVGISAKGNILIQVKGGAVVEAVGGEMFFDMRDEILKELDTASSVN